MRLQKPMQNLVGFYFSFRMLLVFLCLKGLAPGVLFM